MRELLLVAFQSLAIYLFLVVALARFGRMTMAGLAAERGWSLKRFRKALGPAVKSGMIEVNERGHYRFPIEDMPQAKPATGPNVEGQTIGEDYFPVSDASSEEVEDYFAPPKEPGPEPEPRRWISPQIEQILRQARKLCTQQGAVWDARN